MAEISRFFSLVAKEDKLLSNIYTKRATHNSKQATNRTHKYSHLDTDGTQQNNIIELGWGLTTGERIHAKHACL